MIVDVAYDERYWYPDDGGQVWLAGYQVVDPATGGYLARDAPALIERGLRVAAVAGAARHHGEALGSDALAPGRRSCCGATRPTRTTPTRSPSIRPAAVSRRAGCRASSRPRSRPDLDAGRPWSAVVLREQRPSPRDPRSGLTMLLASAEAIELRGRS